MATGFIEGLSVGEWLKHPTIQKTFDYFKYKYGKSLPFDEIESIGNFAITKAFRGFNQEYEEAKFDKYFYKTFSNDLNTACNKKTQEHELRKKYFEKVKNDRRADAYPFTPFSFLTKKENSIIYKKFWENKNLREISEEFGVSFQYISVVLNKALDKLRKDFADKGISVMGGVF